MTDNQSPELEGFEGFEGRVAPLASKLDELALALDRWSLKGEDLYADGASPAYVREALLTIKEQAAEIERLRAYDRLRQADIMTLGDQVAAAEARITALEGERDRLREALEHASKTLEIFESYLDGWEEENDREATAEDDREHVRVYVNHLRCARSSAQKIQAALAIKIKDELKPRESGNG